MMDLNGTRSMVVPEMSLLDLMVLCGILDKEKKLVDSVSTECKLENQNGRRFQDQPSELLVVLTETLGFVINKETSINTPEEDGEDKQVNVQISVSAMMVPSGLLVITEKVADSPSTNT